MRCPECGVELTGPSELCAPCGAPTARPGDYPWPADVAPHARSPWSRPKIIGYSIFSVESSPAVEGHTVYVGSDNEKVYALNAGS